MADNQKTFFIRVASALLGAAVVFAISYFGGTRGIQLVCVLASMLAVREFARMTFFKSNIPLLVSWVYLGICAGLYFLLYRNFDLGLEWIAAAFILFLVSALWLCRNRVQNEELLKALALGCFGIIYCVILPFFAFRIASLDQGGQWFFFLLLVVFFGDTFAYFGGRWFGRHKLMPLVSPNKTWQGTLSGLLGSCVAGLLLVSSVFQEVPKSDTLIFCLFCGLTAQSGDLLISLVKRVAQVKDSGHLMPGHGGILDRLDGIFIACPLVYAFALYVRPL